MEKDKQIVTLQSIFESPEWQNSNARLPLALGKDTDGNVIVTDLARMPHLLISGVTGSGKSHSAFEPISRLILHSDYIPQIAVVSCLVDREVKNLKDMVTCLYNCHLKITYFAVRGRMRMIK